MTDGLKEARSKMSRCLRRRACDPRTLFPGKVQVREQVREARSKPELRVARARIRVLEQDVKVAEAQGQAALARERAKPPRVRTERVEVPGPVREVEVVKEVPVERSHTPAEVEAELREVPPAARQRIAHRALEEVEALRTPRERHIVGHTEDVRPARIVPEP